MSHKSEIVHSLILFHLAALESVRHDFKPLEVTHLIFLAEVDTYMFKF